MFWKRRRSNKDFRAEVRSHIDIETERLIGEGFAPAEAGRMARQTFGNVTAVEECFYESQRTALWLDDFVRDVRHALRSLVRTPTFTAVALLSRAMGIGANTVIFGLMDRVMFELLPVREPGRLVELLTDPGSAAPGIPSSPFNFFSYQALEHFRANTQLCSRIIA